MHLLPHAPGQAPDRPVLGMPLDGDVALHALVGHKLRELPRASERSLDAGVLELPHLTQLVGVLPPRIGLELHLVPHTSREARDCDVHDLPRNGLVVGVLPPRVRLELHLVPRRPVASQDGTVLQLPCHRDHLEVHPLQRHAVHRLPHCARTPFRRDLHHLSPQQDELVVLAPGLLVHLHHVPYEAVGSLGRDLHNMPYGRLELGVQAPLLGNV